MEQALCRRLNFPTIAAALLGGALASTPVFAAQQQGQDPIAILKSMSNYLGNTKAFSVDANIAQEVVKYNGEKLQIVSDATIDLQRPSHMFIERKGGFSDAEFIYDGSTLTVYGKDKNIYSQIKAPGTINDAVLAYEADTGIPAPGADLLFSDVYKELSKGIQESSYVGESYVNGVKCYSVAFRNKEVDWQLWVQAGDTPLPMKYVITSKLQAAAPEYILTFRNWNTNPTFSKNRFAFSPPQGAEQLAIKDLTRQVAEFAALEERSQ